MDLGGGSRLPGTAMMNCCRIRGIWASQPGKVIPAGGTFRPVSSGMVVSFAGMWRLSSGQSRGAFGDFRICLGSCVQVVAGLEVNPYLGSRVERGA